MANGSDRLYCSVTWKIWNYLNAPFEVDKIFESPEFETNFKVPMKWKFGITGRRKERKSDTLMTEFTLRPFPPADKLQRTDVRIRITGEIKHEKGSCKGESSSVGEIKHEKGSCKGEISSTGEIEHKNVWHEGKISFAYPEGIRFSSEKIFSNVENDYKPGLAFATITMTCDFLHDDPFEEDMRSVSDDLKDSLTSKTRDLCLKLGNQKFFVHKAITARSPYIARILDENPKLSQIDLTGKCSENQLNGLIKFWHTGDIDELPRTSSPSTLNFLFNMQEVRLRPYIVPETIEISTTFEIRDDAFEWDITPSEKNKGEPMDEDKLEDEGEPMDVDKKMDEGETMKKVYKYGDETRQLCIDPNVKSGNEERVSFHIKLQRGLGHLRYLEVYLNDQYGAGRFRKSIFSSLSDADLEYENYQFENFMKHKEFIDLPTKLQKGKRILVACKVWRCGIKHHIYSVLGPVISTTPTENPSS